MTASVQPRHTKLGLAGAEQATMTGLSAITFALTDDGANPSPLALSLVIGIAGAAALAKGAYATDEDIAASLGARPGTVRSQISRGLTTDGERL